MPEVVETGPDLVLLLRRIEALGAGVSALVARAPDLQAPVPGLEWDVRQVALHLAVQAERYRDFVLGARSPEQDLVDVPGAHRDRVAAVNQALVDAEPLLAAPALAERLHAAVHELTRVLAGAGPDAPFRSWEGDSDVRTGAATFLGELLVHGQDLARAGGAAWPVRPEDARAALHAVLALLPRYVDAERTAHVDARLQLRVRGGPDLLLAVRHGTAHVRPGRGPADATIAVGPVPLLLLAYRRRALPTAVARGELLVWGRRPWRALQLLRWFTAP